MRESTLKERIAALSDRELEMIIRTVVAAAGMDADKAAEMTSDIPTLRNKLLRTDDGQLSEVLRSLGSTDAEKLLRSLGKK